MSRIDKEQWTATLKATREVIDLALKAVADDDELLLEISVNGALGNLHLLELWLKAKARADEPKSLFEQSREAARKMK